MAIVSLIKKWFAQSQTVQAMILIQAFATGMQLLSKVVLTQGTFVFALITYRHMIAAVSVAPFACYFERGEEKKFSGLLMNVFPHKYWATMLTCIIAVLQSAVLGLCLDTNAVAWRLDWNLQLLTIVYSGVFVTTVTFCLLTWVISKPGLTYPSMFNSLNMILVAVFETLFLVKPSEVEREVDECIPSQVLQSAVLGLCLETSAAAWRLDWDLQLLTIVYSAHTKSCAKFGSKYSMGQLEIGITTTYRDTMTTYATNFLNLIPVVTFILSISFKLEKVNVHTKTGEVDECIPSQVFQSAVLGLCLETIAAAWRINSDLQLLTIVYSRHNGNLCYKLSELNPSCHVYLIYLFQMKLMNVFPHKYCNQLCWAYV
ncbi:WAT1-related protein At2g37450-like [Humulus lupulus]|uniref:WAT1-related protein At2g37450-like n=1 Tax=Humulus lupulus TaxID=3486 RepID=UPI002B40826C|nr:WAT1-related protein At2g37450-like [Humulus lupulus]